MKTKERQEIKTDRFQELLLRAEEFVLDNAKTIVFSVIGVIVLLALYFGLSAFMQGQAEAASFALHQHVDSFNEILATPQEEMDAELLNKTRSGLESVVADHGGSQAANRARLYIGLLDFKAGNITEAESAFSEFAGQNSGHLSDMAKFALSGIQVREENFEAAAQMFQRLSQSYKGGSARLFAFRSAELFKLAGMEDAATEMFRKAQSTEENDTLFSPAQSKVIETHLSSVAAE